MVAEASFFCVLCLKWGKNFEARLHLHKDICKEVFCWAARLTCEFCHEHKGCPASLTSENESWPLLFLSELLQMFCYVKQCKE